MTCTNPPVFYLFNFINNKYSLFIVRCHGLAPDTETSRLISNMDLI